MELPHDLLAVELTALSHTDELAAQVRDDDRRGVRPDQRGAVGGEHLGAEADDGRDVRGVRPT